MLAGISVQFNVQDAANEGTLERLTIDLLDFCFSIGTYINMAGPAAVAWFLGPETLLNVVVHRAGEHPCCGTQAMATRYQELMI
jgi:hypothetical protein